MLTQDQFLAGIGNADTDEVLFEAVIFPYKKRSAFSHEELVRLHLAIPRVLHHAIAVLREHIGENTPQGERLTCGAR